MKSLTLILPDSFELDGKETLTFLASKLYEKGSLTLGQTAERLPMSKPEEFLHNNIIHRHGN